MRSFGHNGVAQKSFAPANPSVSGLEVTGTKIFVSGNVYSNDEVSTTQPVLLNYGVNGVFNANFGNSGNAIFPPDEESMTTDMAVYPVNNTQPIVVGTVSVEDTVSRYNNWLYLPIVWKFETSGRLDTDFNRGGVFFDPTLMFGSPVQVLVDTLRSSIYVLGIRPYTLLDASPQYSGIMKLRMDGTLDTTFGDVLFTPGIVSFNDQHGVLAAKMDWDANGNIIVAEAEDEDDGYHIVLARYTRDGQLDTSFGQNGYADDERAFTPCAQDAAAISAVHVTKNNEIGVMGGRCENGVMTMFLRYYDDNGVPRRNEVGKMLEVTKSSDDSHHIVWRDFIINDIGWSYYIVGDVFSYGGAQHGQHMQVWKYDRWANIGRGFADNGVYIAPQDDCYSSKIKMDEYQHYYLYVAGVCKQDITLWKLATNE